MLAPALLAAGLLVAELTGYQAAARGIVAGVGPRESGLREGGGSGVREGGGSGGRGGAGAGEAGGGGEVEAWGVVGGPGNGGAGSTVAMVPVSVAPVRSVVLEPRIVPPPYRPERIYGGWAPPVVNADVRPSAADASPAEVPSVARRMVPREESPAPHVRQAPQSEPPDDTFGCPTEWRETWLWEVCKEQARRET